MTRPGANISTEHQKKGDAKRPSDTLDRDADSTDYHYGGDKGRAAEDARADDDGKTA